MIKQNRDSVKAKVETIIQITNYSKIWKDHASGVSENREPKQHGIINLPSGEYEVHQGNNQKRILVRGHVLNLLTCENKVAGL
jgi:hypothetical protein